MAAFLCFVVCAHVRVPSNSLPRRRRAARRQHDTLPWASACHAGGQPAVAAGAVLAAPPTAAPTTHKAAVGTGSSQRTIGIVAGGVGIVALGVAGYFALTAKSKASDSDAYCSGTKCTDQKGVDLRDDAVKSADMASIASGIGALGLVGGAILYFTAPSGVDKKAGRRAGPTIVAGPASILVKGVW